MVAPKAFISYSWSSSEHIDRVRSLAERLLQDGVDVVLDQWDLKPGHDAFAYMEQMVTDPLVTKIIIVCDRRYAEKADGRAGGVGSEALIISPQVYKKAAQDKCGIIVTEFDDHGQAVLPTFMSGRIYFNFAARELEGREYESLLRWLHDRPLLTKPMIGKPPAFLDVLSPNLSLTMSAGNRLVRLLKDRDPRSSSALRDYGERLYGAFSSIKPNFAAFDTHAPYLAIFSALGELRPYIVEFRSICEFAAVNLIDERIVTAFCDLFEKIGATMYRDKSISSWNEIQFDAQRYAAFEMFLSFINSLKANQRFEQIGQIFDHSFYIENLERGRGTVTCDVTVFLPNIRSFQMRNEHTQMRLYSPVGGFLKENVKEAQNLFQELMETELILYLRSQSSQKFERVWYPLSLVYATERFRVFPLFARCESGRFLSKALQMFGETTPQALVDLIKTVASAGEIRNSWNVMPLAELTNLEYIASKS